MRRRVERLLRQTRPAQLRRSLPSRIRKQVFGSVNPAGQEVRFRE